MKKKIRVRTSNDHGFTKVKVLMRHPMDTGLMKDKATGKNIPAHFITEVVCHLKGAEVFKALWGIAISTNPYLSFLLKDVSAGDQLSITWKDNMGQSESIIHTV